MLCLDCGNTRLKWGVRENRTWLATGAILNAEISRLATYLPAGYKVDTAIGCNVAGIECGKLIETALSMPVRWIAATENQCGVVSSYDNPSSLGADRWAALIGARALHEGAALVVLAGTATTIDVLDADGRFLGGLILPGVSMMANMLATGTASLPISSGGYQAIPGNTHDAIAGGAIHATLGAIERMFGMLSANARAVCLLSGGAADILQPHLDLPLRRIDNLVLEGLACIATEPAP